MPSFATLRQLPFIISKNCSFQSFCFKDFRLNFPQTKYVAFGSKRIESRFCYILCKRILIALGVIYVLMISMKPILSMFSLTVFAFCMNVVILVRVDNLQIANSRVYT